MLRAKVVHVEDHTSERESPFELSRHWGRFTGNYFPLNVRCSININLLFLSSQLNAFDVFPSCFIMNNFSTEYICIYIYVFVNLL